jgi:hypothetical protein
MKSGYAPSQFSYVFETTLSNDHFMALLFWSLVAEKILIFDLLYFWSWLHKHLIKNNHQVLSILSIWKKKRIVITIILLLEK